MRAPKIHGLRIERFRAIQQPLELDFTMPRGDPADLVVLAGPNGSGKTSILEAILPVLGEEVRSRPSSTGAGTSRTAERAERCRREDA